MFEYLEKLIQNERIFHDALDWLYYDGAHVETSNLMLESLNPFLEHLLDFFVVGILENQILN